MKRFTTPAILLVALAVCFMPAIVTAETTSARVTIDAARTGAPISKYIYGQFIEHLGRCIYGGIWAEMLEDRKFFVPLGDRHCAWTVLGDPAAARMSSDKPFVGSHTPALLLAGKVQGIAQGELGLQAGKKYAGRIWLAGAPAVGPVRVRLAWGQGDQSSQTVVIDKVSETFSESPLEFTAGATTDNGRLEISASGQGTLRVGTVSLMPGDNVQGMRSDTLAVLRELDAPVYRWPGGNFVSGYNWRDGVGPRDRRPPRKNPAWKGIEHNDFGIDEFMTFCRLLGTEPYVALNSGQGDVASAVAEVQYLNGAATTPEGRRRSENGHPERYGVVWIGVGNEMYGKWQLGHMPLEDYLKKHNQFAQAIRAEDPKAKLVAVGNVGRWSEETMRHCAGHMDLISEHFYCKGNADLISHVHQISDRVRAVAEAHRRYRKQIDSLAGKDIRIALDEWNYWSGPHEYGELGTRYYLRDALGIAAGLNEYARQSDIVFMANYAQTVNVIGAIKTTKTAAALDATGVALKLYRRHFGVVPVATSGGSPLDIAAAWSEDRKTLTLGVVNPSLQPATLALDVRGASLSGSGTAWQVAGSDPMASNSPGKPLKVTIAEKPLAGIADQLSVEPCSATVFALPVR